MSLRQNLFVKIVAAYVVFGFILMEVLWFVWCRPFSDYWAGPPDDRRYSLHVPTHIFPIREYESSQQIVNCSAETNHMITNAVLNISSDIMIIALPMPVFLQSQLAVKRKIILCGVFALGIFTVGLSA